MGQKSLSPRVATRLGQRGNPSAIVKIEYLKNDQNHATKNMTSDVMNKITP